MKKSMLCLGAVFAALLLTSTFAPASALTVAPDPALAAVFAGASLPQADLMPKPTLKCGPFCSTSWSYTTATVSGSGSTCSAAQSSLDSQLSNIASGKCDNLGPGTCNLVVHNTSSCTLIAPGTHQIQGYATYNCKDTSC